MVARRRSRGGLWLTLGAVAAIALGGIALWSWLESDRPVTNPAEYEQLTDVTDGAVAPVLSPDGHMLAFIRNGTVFKGNGQVWLKVLPNGEPVKLTDAPGPVWAPAFTPDGANVVFSSIDLQHGSWDTWTVPAIGGAHATKLLANAQALTYIGPREVLYSEFNSGLHLAVATSLDDRSLHREVYVPVHERGMAHFSSLSPDRKSILIVEMGATGLFERCRLVPFDGSTTGYEVGPPASSCLATAWSPDGKWMYFSATTSSGSHLWRQSFPNGQPQQITFGPNEEQTVLPTPDGRSLLTSIGLSQSTLWFHKGDTERPLSIEGRVYAPWLSADAKRVYFLTTRSATIPFSLARMDLGTGTQEPLVPGFIMSDYDISPDEQQVAFSTVRDGVRQIWLASLDRHKPPTLLVHGGDQPQFGGDYMFFRRVGEHASYLHRIRKDGSGESRLLPDPIVEILAAAPDGKAVVAARPSVENHIDAWLIPVDGASLPRVLNQSYSPSRWSHDGRTLYVGLNVQKNIALSGTTVALPVGADDLPLGKLPAADAGAPSIPHPADELAVGPDPSVYVFVKSEQRQNIYRIPLH